MGIRLLHQPVLARVCEGNIFSGFRGRHGVREGRPSDVILVNSCGGAATVPTAAPDGWLAWGSQGPPTSTTRTASPSEFLLPSGIGAKTTPAGMWSAAQKAAQVNEIPGADLEDPDRVVRSGRNRGLSYASFMGDPRYMRFLTTVRNPRPGVRAVLSYLRFARDHEVAVAAGSNA